MKHRERQSKRVTKTHEKTFVRLAVQMCLVVAFSAVFTLPAAAKNLSRATLESLIKSPVSLIKSPIAPPIAKETWLQIKSKNFTLVGNASEKEIRGVALRLEQFRNALTLLLPKAKFDSSEPTVVVVFKNDGAFKPYKPLYNGKPANVAGVFQPGEGINYITLTPVRRGGGAENPYGTIFHELVHLMIENSSASLPTWINEGLAEFYSTFEMADDDKKIIIGKAIANHIFTLREKYMPLDVLFQVDGRSPLYNEKDKQSIFYAQSWALIHYMMMHERAAHRPRLGRFITLLDSGKSVEESFRQAFEMDFKAMEKQLQSYVRSSSYNIQDFRFDEQLQFDREMQTAMLSDAEAAAYLGDLLLHSNRLDAAEAKLNEAIGLDKSLAQPHAALGLMYVRKRDFAKAKAALERASELDSKDYRAHFYYALALSREGEGEGGLVTGYAPESLAKMRAEIKKAIGLAPNHAESYNLLGFIELIAGDNLAAGEAAVKRALQLAPGKSEYSYILAQIELRGQKYAEARRTVARALRGTSNAELLARLQNLNEAIAKVEASRRDYERQVKEYEARAQTVSEREGSESASGNGESASRLKPRQPNASGEGGGEGNVSSEVSGFDKSLKNVRLTIKRGAEGEYVRGTLTRLECTARGVTFHVDTDKGKLKFFAASLEVVNFTAYVENAGDAISCGVLKKPMLVVLTYKPATSSAHGGNAIAVDFIPDNVEIEP